MDILREKAFRNTLLCGAIPIAIGLCTATASAQTATQSSTPPEQTAQQTATPPAGTGLGEIIVTAQKRAENLQRVPIAVTAVTPADVERLHATDLSGLKGALPNVQLDHFGSTSNAATFYIRGIGVNDPDPYAGNTVSIVVDGVPQYFSQGAFVNLYDISRVEVLRGPQGTLFGANATGGAINIISEAPTNKFGGKAEVTGGNYNRIDLSGSLNVPLSDTLYARFGIQHTRRDGFLTNIVNGKSMDDRNITLFRASLKYAPASNFDATFIGEYDRSRNGASPAVNGAAPGEQRYLAPGSIVNGALLPMYQNPCPSVTQRCVAPDKFYSAVDSMVPDKDDLDNFRGTLTMNLRGTALGDITSITGYRHYTLKEFGDENGSPVFGNAIYRPTKGWQFSEELRSQINWANWLKSTIGVFYLKTHYFQIQNNLAQSTKAGFSTINQQEQDNHSISVFLQNYLNITKKLRLQGGFRFTHEWTALDVNQVNLINPSGLAQFTGGVVTSSLTASGAKSWNNEGYRLGLDYQILDRTMIYGYWARGFKSGGFVGRITTPAAIGPFNPEKVDTFEIGAKSELFDRRLRINADVFYTNYRGMQLPQINYLPNAQGVIVQANTVLNVPKAVIKGVEAELTANPFRGLTLTATGTYLYAKYKRFCFFDTTYHPASGVSDPGCPTTVLLRNMRNFDLQNSPKFTATASATYEFPFLKGTMSANVLYLYSAKKYLSAINDSPRSVVQPTHITNVNLDWSPEGARWSIGVWSTNLFNHHYIAQALDLPGIWDLVVYAPPREFGGTVKIKF